MSQYIFDSDAWLCARKLAAQGVSLIDRFLAAPAGYLPVILTEFLAKNELCDLQDEIMQYVQQDKVRIVAVGSRDQNWKRLTKKGVHKGEAESISWLLQQSGSSRPVFVTRDKGAADQAREENLRCTDLLGFAIDLMDIKLLSEDECREALSVWDDKRRQDCRPKDWDDFDQAVKRRRDLGWPYFKP